MSRGLGVVQRAMLIALARIHIAAAEEAAQQQQRRRHTPRIYVSVEAVIRNAAEHELSGDVAQCKQKSADALAEVERRAAAGDADAKGMLAWSDGARAMFAGRTRYPKPAGWTSRRLLEKYNPSRAVSLLHKRGLVYGWSCNESRDANLSISAAGFALGVRLGELRSDIVDLEQMAQRLSI